jgi:hypothetical protein
MTYLVNIDFKRGTSLSLEVTAETEQRAIFKAVQLAPQYGFDQPVKKAKAIPQGEQA